MLKIGTLIVFLITLAQASFAATINGEYPVCNSKEGVLSFGQAKMFDDYAKMQELIESGECIFVEPDIKASIIEKSYAPKIMVFVPYQSPITGWTEGQNLR